MYIDDCVEGTLRLTDASRAAPVNIGSSELVTHQRARRLVEDIAGVDLSSAVTSSTLRKACAAATATTR